MPHAFRPGELWQQVCQTTSKALASGHLFPTKTSAKIVRDGGVDFVIRVVDGLARKPRRSSTTPSGNPFLPFDAHLWVADVSMTHVALLNKFMVVDHHLLIVTREFQRQGDPLEPSDFDALARCLWQYDSVAFYNSGTVAGASQPHRHLQLIPLPLDERLASVPVEAKLRVETEPADRVLQSSELPFTHRWWKFSDTASVSASSFAEACHHAYEALVADVGWPVLSDDTPYNLQVTRQWMVLVPRCEECFEGISLNAMAYMGMLLVRDEAQLTRLAKAGPMTALRMTAGQQPSP